MSMHPTLRSDLAHLAGRRVSLSAPLPAYRNPSQIIVDLEPGEWIDITVPAYIAAAQLARAN